MPEPVHVPDIPGSRERLCWEQDPVTLARCDRCLGHAGLHTWEWAEAELAALRAVLDTAEGVWSRRRMAARRRRLVLQDTRENAGGEDTRRPRSSRMAIPLFGTADFQGLAEIRHGGLMTDSLSSYNEGFRDGQAQGCTNEMHLVAIRNLPIVEAELVAARADIANWPVCEQHKPGMWDGDPPCVICEAHTAIADLAALKGRTCETCRESVEATSGTRYCIGPGHGVACEEFGFTCGEWAAKEQP